MNQKSTLKTFLWFNETLEEALEFYKTTFKDVVIKSSGRPEPGGTLRTAEFSIFGHNFVGMGWPGGPVFNDSISLFISCDGQEETDRLWDAFTQEGSAGQCGWCKDKFGVSWQVSPIQMREHLENPDPVKSAYAWNAMRSMTKIIISELHE